MKKIILLSLLALSFSSQSNAQSLTIINQTPFTWVGDIVATNNPANPQYTNSFESYETIPPGNTVYPNALALSNPTPFYPGTPITPSAIFIGMKGGLTINGGINTYGDATVGTPGVFLGYPLTNTIMIPPSSSYTIHWTIMGNNIIVHIQ